MPADPSTGVLSTTASSSQFRVVGRCRVCGSPDLHVFLDLGATPLANAFVRPERLGGPEERFPLEAQRCDRCGLVQLTIVVRPEIMFRDYAYASSASAPMLEHFAQQADEVVGRFAPPGSLVVEIGSNDGVLLRPLAAHGVKAIGVEPAVSLAKLANDEGLETWNEFFGQVVARRLAGAKGRASAVVANNVLAHIDDLEELLVGLDVLLGTDGVFVAEVPYLGDLLERTEYDTIYHEHLSYFAAAPLQRLFERGGLELFDVRRLSIHGGSIRIYAGRAGRHPISAELRTLLRDEAGALGEPAVYERFVDRVRTSREELVALLAELKGGGARLAGYGATAKGNTLLNYCRIGPETLEFIADTTPYKQGLVTPGMHIPVRPEAALMDELPDYALLLAWNYASAILARRADYAARGGRFIHPIPTPRLLPE